MKKIISFIVCICLLVNVFCVTAGAVKPDIVVEFCEGEYIDYTETQYDFSENSPVYFFNHFSGKPIYSCYSLLNELEKVYYDTILNLDKGVLSFKIDYSPSLSAAQFNTIDFTKIMHAVCLDHPEIFYYNGYSYGKSYYSSTGEVVSVTYNIIPKKHGQTNQTIYTTANIPGYADALQKAFNSVEVDTSNRYNFIKSVHDYLCNNVDYVNDYASCHDAYGTLVNKKAVCQGYAETVKMFCDYYKIPSVLITGTANGGGHMWNAVQMDDGNWYLLDVTWDDQTKSAFGVLYDFFLIGLNTKDIYFGGDIFSVSHVSDGSPYLPQLNYATVEYTETNHNTEFKATYNSLEINDGHYLIRSCFDVDDTNVYYNGMYVETKNLVTNATFMAPSGDDSNLEEWTLVLLGDCNGDGNCNTADYTVAVNKVLADTEVSDATDMAADIDCDGYLDVIDLSMLQIVTSGLDTDIVIE